MKKLLAVHLLLTLDCNYRCSYCFVRHKPRSMAENTLRKALEFLVNPDVCEKKCHFAFFGGEPLLFSDRLLQGVDYAYELADQRDMSVTFSAVTNMSLATPALLDEFKTRNMSLLASCDGRYTQDVARQAGSFGQVAQNIRTALDKGVSCTVALQVVPGHLSHLCDNVFSIAELGVRSVALNPIVHGRGPKYDEADWTEMEHQFELLSDYLFSQKMAADKPFVWAQMDTQLQAIYRIAAGGQGNQTGDWSCGACKGSLAIDPEGYIVPCQQMPSGTGWDDWILGHVADSAGIDAVKRARFVETKFSDCAECAVLRCAPCRTINRAVTGSEYERTPDQCRYQRLLFTQAIKLHNRLVDAGYRFQAQRTE